MRCPPYWRWGYGMDIGISHPWAVALLCWDVDQDVIHVVAELRMSDADTVDARCAIRALEKRMFNWHMDFRSPGRTMPGLETRAPASRSRTSTSSSACG